MRTISLLFLYAVLLSSCAPLHTQREPEGNYVELARLGINAEDANNNLVVTALQKDFPAELAGVKRGDIISIVDGKNISSTKAFISHMDNKRPGDHVVLVLTRNGQKINLDIEPRVIKVRPTQRKFQQLIDENKHVTVAVVVSEVKNSFPSVPKDWADSIRNNLQSDHESGLLSAFSNNANFSIVDRSRLKAILDEFQFNQIGFVSDKLRVKIGEMTGATHILDISFSRFQGQYNSYEDVMNVRLIEIESGKVLAVDQIKTHN
jgi:membrane-associated protease RseP (regulator of RpoE activity)